MRTMTKALALLLLAAPGCVALTDFGALRPADAGTSADAPGLDDVPGLDAGDAGRSDGGSPDGGSPDGGACAAACAADESCCDGICVTTDTLANCRGCGVVCADGANATASCGAAGCELSCDEGWEDCDAEPGCETDLRAASDCGGCGSACAPGLSCALRGGAYTCVTECSGGEVECDGSCTNLATDPSHCGSCGMDCGTRAGATASCGASGCAFACDAGRGDCNADLASASSDGCETVLVLQYPDADGDGAGAALAAGTLRCPGPGFAPSAGDCDDAASRRAPGLLEECDGIDNDCDLAVDDGFLLRGMPVTVGDTCSCEAGAAAGRVECVAATSVRCAYPTETCNGRDDDCTGGADNIFSCVRGATSACTGTGAGGCSFSGTLTCSDTCTLGACTPPAETCDGTDQNCDGFVDEGLVPFGAPMAFTGASVFGTNAAWDDVGGGALVASIPGGPSTRNQLIFARFDRMGTPMATPILIDDHPMYGLAGDVGWDGTQWVVMYSRYNDTRGVAEILRVHVSPTGMLTRPAGVVADAESVAIAMGSGGVLGVVTARFLGPTNTGMQFGTYAAGVFTRPLAFLTTVPMTSSALVARAGPSSFYAVGTDASGLFYQRFDATGPPGMIVRPAIGPVTEALAVDSEGTNLVVLSTGSSGPRLSVIPSSGTPTWTTMLRMPGFQGTVGVLGGELWTSFTDMTAQRVRPVDGTPVPESYRYACDAILAVPGAPFRGLCFAGQEMVPILRCP